MGKESTMKLHRRQLFQTAVASAVATSTSSAFQSAPKPGTADWSALREDFPWLKTKLWLTAADYHPISIHSYRAMEDYLKSRAYGESSESSRQRNRQNSETKDLFGKLINAKPSEIAFVQSTTDGENIIVSGLD